MNNIKLTYQIFLTLILFFSTTTWLAADPLTANTAQKKHASTATLPLAEILDLYQQKQRANQKEIELPPIDASINEITVQSQLLENAMQITAAFDIAVLNDEKWVTIPLFTKDSNVHIYQLPTLKHGYIVQDRQNISYITKKRGSVRFDISMIKQAQIQDKVRNIEIEFSPASKTLMDINYDEGLFRLVSDDSHRQGDGAVIYPQQGIFSLAWQPLNKTSMKRKSIVKPPLEPMIKRAQISSIATLEGQLITRILYDLHFEGTEQLNFSIPEHYTLNKVYLNGSAVPFMIKKGQVSLEVFPARAGDRQGKLELSLTRHQGKFHLAGELQFDTPLISWPIREMAMKIYLPEVFNYTYEGGSMAITQVLSAAKFTYDLPTPGKSFNFHQLLITSSAPSVKINYAVDLKGKYFSGD